MILRPMHQIDLSEVLTIEKICKLSPWSIKDYESEVVRQDSVCLIYNVKNKIAGFLIMRKINLKELELYNIGVLPDFQNKGIGSALLLQAIKQAKKDGGEIILLEVRESNRSAVKFYRHHDFVIEGKRKNFYSHPVEDAYIMKLVL